MGRASCCLAEREREKQILAWHVSFTTSAGRTAFANASSTKLEVIPRAGAIILLAKHRARSVRVESAGSPLSSGAGYATVALRRRPDELV